MSAAGLSLFVFARALWRNFLLMLGGFQVGQSAQTWPAGVAVMRSLHGGTVSASRALGEQSLWHVSHQEFAKSGNLPPTGFPLSR